MHQPFLALVHTLTISDYFRCHFFPNFSRRLRNPDKRKLLFFTWRPKFVHCLITPLNVVRSRRKQHTSARLTGLQFWLPNTSAGLETWLNRRKLSK